MSTAAVAACLLGIGLFALYLRARGRAKEAKSKLVREERRRTAILDAIPDAVLELDLDGRIYNCNTACAKLFTRTVASLQGVRLPDLLPTNAAAVCGHALLEAHACGRSAGRVMDLPFAGVYASFELSVALKIVSPGAEPRCVMVARDITERKQMEHALIEREKDFRAIFDNLLDTVYLLEVTQDGRFRNLKVNAAFERSSGMRNADLMGRFIEETVPPETAAVVNAKYQRCVAARELIEEEVTLDLPAGRRHYHSTLIPIFDASRRVAQIVGISRDVTERKRMVDQLRASEEKFRTLAENAPAVILRYDLECRPIYVNNAFEREFGIAPEDILDCPITERWANDRTVSAELYTEKLRGVIATGLPCNVQMSLLSVDGHRHHHSIRMVAERDLGGSVIGVLAVGYDVSALTEAQIRLEDSRQQLRELSALREAARDQERKAIAHEIHDEAGQVLTALKLGLATLRMEFGAGDTALSDRIRRLNELADHAIGVIRDVAHMLRPAALDMGVVPAIEWLAQEFERSSGVRCAVSIPPGLRCQDEELGMCVFRVVQESLTNAARHASATRVDIVLECVPPFWQLTVKDDGVGFAPPAVGRRAFGLLGMRERVARAGGALRIDSNPGYGTCIQVCIPLPHDNQADAVSNGDVSDAHQNSDRG